LQDPTYFISDLHLEASRPDISEAFQQFLARITGKAEALYILGDFFNAWIGDDDNSTFIAKIKALLAKSTEAGLPIYFIHGNRDFLIGQRFADDTGVVILPEHHIVSLNGEKVLLLHGDSLCTDDTAYQDFRAKVRNPRWQKKVLAYPLFFRRWLAAYMRYRSRNSNSNKPENIMDVCEKEVQQQLCDFEVNTMIHGHTHRPDRHQYPASNSERIVLGDWEQKGWYLKADTDGMTLVDFPIETNGPRF